jgi:DNA mismatch repair protein MutL
VLYLSKGGAILPNRIVILPDDLTNKIAAGEVIERPASIVKELLENALDAGATDIVIELRNGGCESVRVTDNGAGIDPEDAVLAFSRFATSKIYHFDDIYKVDSFGFRGEALPSIASIAHVEMVTKQQGALAGVRVAAEAGNIKEISEAGSPVGTSVFVSNIFGPVPVRRKFLKSEQTEQGHCLDVISRLALAHPALSLKVAANGRQILNIPATTSPDQRLALVLGTDFLDQMIFLSGKRDGLVLQGFASLPSLTRANTKHIYPFVNRRFIRDHLINHAVMTAYRNLIPTKRYPAVVLLLELPPQEVDVNVHPAKMEVRFRDPRAVYETIVECFAGALSGVPSPAAVQTGESLPRAPHAFPLSLHHSRVEEALKRYTISSAGPKENAGTPRYARESFPTINYHNALTGDAPASMTDVALSDYKYIGQVMNSYLIFASAERLILVDQHAAHERVIFENLKNKPPSHSHIASQRLLMPEVISLPPRDYALMMDCLPLLQECGFEVEPFGLNTIVVKSLPSLFATRQPQSLINDFLAEFSEREGASLDEKKDKIYAFLACKGAIKANHELSPPEVAALVKDLDAIPNIASCPHGRPVFLAHTLWDLEKMFKRR